MRHVVENSARTFFYAIVAVAAIALIAASCGDDDDTTADAPAEVTDAAGDSSAETSDGAAAEGDGAAAEGDGAAPGEGGNGGTLALGEETISFDSARCFLEEQDAAAGGGKILFVAQAFGTNAAGDEISIDVSRYDEDSQFTGDDVIVDIGDPFSEDAQSLNASTELGTVQVDGSTLSAADLTFVSSDDGSELEGSFRIDC